MTFIVPERKRATQVGETFGRLTVVGIPFYFERWNCRHQHVVCRCSCGTHAIVLSNYMRSGGVSSCGCLRVEMASNKKLRHGETGTRLWTIWATMKARCSWSGHIGFSHYGGRGIRVCEEWQRYEAFRDWAMANGYRDDLTIDRVDNDGNYEPSNCRWASPSDQCNNRRYNRVLEAFGEKKNLIQWVRDARCVVSESTLAGRLHRGWEVERALTERV